MTVFSQSAQSDLETNRYSYKIDPEDSLSTASRILRLVGVGKRVLELGVATGSMSAGLKNNKCVVVGIEINSKAAEFARQFCEKVIVADINQFDWESEFKEDRFDVIVAADVLEHLIDPWSCLEQIKKLLKKDGYIVVSIPNVAYIGIVSSIYSGEFQYQDKGLLDSTHLRFFTYHELEIALVASGYLPEKLERVELAPTDSEFRENWNSLPSHAKTALAKSAEGNTYQFVVRAYPASRPLWNQYLREKKTREDADRNLIALLTEKAAYQTEKARYQEAKITELNQIVHIKDKQHTAIIASTSWRITRPLRFIASQLAGIIRIAKRTKIFNSQHGGLRNILKKTIALLNREGISGIKRGIRLFGQSGETFDRNDYTRWIQLYDTLSDQDHNKIRDKLYRLEKTPLISVIMPVYNPALNMLEEAIKSVQAQLYWNWELCIADDASTDQNVHKLLQRYADLDPRIKVTFRNKNGHIAAATNSALALAEGEYIALFDQDDLLSAHALFWVADAISRNPTAKLIYSDEDKIHQSGYRFDPYFKSDWNPDLFLSQNLICHLGVYLTSLVRNLGGFREGYDGAQDYDLALRCIEGLTGQQIVHIPRVLYHWRSHSGSTALAAGEKNYALTAGQRALNDHFERTKVSAKAELLNFGMYRVHYTIPTIDAPFVSIIIPTRNGLTLIKRCIESIFLKTTYPNYEILIVDNNSDDPDSLAYFSHLSDDQRVRIIRDVRPFNYSAINNSAVKQARGEYICLMNNDVEVISPEWLGEMISLAMQPGVGAVGARLLYPDNTLQHGGVIIGLGGVAGHSHKHIHKSNPGKFYRAQLIQTLSAVTAACLVIKKSIFEEIGGLNETNLKVAFNDVDFCLRLRETGYRNVWTPYAELYHHESATRGHENTPEKQARFIEEVQYMRKRWGDELLHDPYYSPNLTLKYEDFSLAWPPRVSHLEANLLLDNEYR